MATIYARLLNQYKFKYHTVFSARFDKQTEDGQILDETELYINLSNNLTLAESDLDNTDIRSQLENQIQQQEKKDSGWRFDKNISMIFCFFQTCIMNGSNYIKRPLRRSAILNVENDDKYSFCGQV